jgi:NAD(P)H-dependent flavin oxidoreductase YrpB (nitropropane dioxygenase family)
MENRITTLFGIQYPIIQAGMIWCSGWRLASAVSNAGGLGLIGSASMYPDILRGHINLLVSMWRCYILILISICRSSSRKG